MMSDTNIIIAVAKLDGFINVHSLHIYKPDYPNFIWVDSENVIHTAKRVPNYLTSHDAIIPVIEKCINTKEEVWNFSVNLSKILTETDEDYQELSPVDYLSSTPKQLSIALLKATGNYREE